MRRAVAGFTLAELLIALVILGVIATFTIPKVLQSQQNSKYAAIGKETASMISGAYTAYLQQNGYSTAMVGENLTPYMNYVAWDTSSALDDWQTSGTINCSTAAPCILLHNGARLAFDFNSNFNGSAVTNAIDFIVDPDGQVTDGTTNGPGKGLPLVLYYGGRITTEGAESPNTCFSYGCFNPNPAIDPPWFSWN